MSEGLFNISDPRPVHFVGIAGAGMSALAELFVRRGVLVTGCDANLTGASDLQRLGVELLQGHDPSHVEKCRALVTTSAMPKRHPEIERARELGIPVVRRAEALGEAVNAGTVVGVSGTHGKTTTTVLVTEALAAAGRNPTGIVGGRVAAWEGNLRRGGDDTFVVEADEYDRSFLALVPTVAVVTNLEADHLDIYADLDDIRGAFSTFVRPARWVVCCADDPGANTLPYPVSAEVLRYGLGAADGRPQTPDARIVGAPRLLGDGRTAISVWFDGAAMGEVVIGLPGDHNARNTLAAVGTGLAFGLPMADLARGLAQVVGAERRFQRLGVVGGIQVVDDYAHHPTEVAATLSAARSAYPGRRIVAAFQPHLFSRTRDFATDFAAALGLADVLLLTEIYPAREQPMEGVTSALIADPMALHGKAPVWRGERSGLAEALMGVVREGDVVITLGAGDITKTGPELLARLGAAKG